MSTISTGSTIGLVLTNSTLTNPVYIAAGVTISNSGGNGVSAAKNTWTIDNSGIISGVDAFDLSGGGFLGNAAGATVTGGANGIYVHGGVETVANHGSIAATAGNGIYLVLSGGLITNAASAAIYGQGDGIKADLGTATVVNAGSITGGQFGIALKSGGLVTNAVTGFINSSEYGVGLYGVGTVTNLGLITARFTGVEFRGSSVAGTVLNSGGIDSTSETGVYLPNGGLVANAAFALISGFRDGIDTQNDDGTAINSGHITGQHYYGVWLKAGGLISNAASGTITGYLEGVQAIAGLGTVINAGSISGTHQYGVYLRNGGVVTNAAGGSIYGYDQGVNIGSGSGTVFNYGSITSKRGAVVRLIGGGFLTNSATASLSGGYGVIVYKGAGTVVNAGHIRSTAHGSVELVSGGVLTNLATGLIQGDFEGVEVEHDGTVINAGGIVAKTGFGIDTYNGRVTVINAASGYIRGPTGAYIDSGTTLINAGDISGVSGTAVALAGIGRDLLVVEPGGHFEGAVIGGASASSTIELASAASSGALSGFGTQIVNIATIAFDPGAHWQIAGNTAGFTGVISGLAVGDAIEITGITATGSSYFAGVLTLEEASGSLDLNIPGNFTINDFTVSNTPVGVQISVSCFRRGTRIRTARGEVPVEYLRIGESVYVHRGGMFAASEPIVWIGHRTIDCRHHAEPSLVWPVRVAAHTFGSGQPARDLYLSPDHAVFFDGVLIPVKYLIDVDGIAQVPVATVEYFHIELGAHGVLLAEGLAVESHLNIGAVNRCDAATGPRVPHPSFAEWTWDTSGCAPLVVSGPKVAALRGRLARHVTRVDSQKRRRLSPARAMGA